MSHTDRGFVEALALVQEVRNVLGVHLQQVILAQVFDAWEETKDLVIQ